MVAQLFHISPGRGRALLGCLDREHLVDYLSLSFGVAKFTRDIIMCGVNEQVTIMTVVLRLIGHADEERKGLG